MNDITTYFDLDCRACPALTTFLDEKRAYYPDYHAQPVSVSHHDKCKDCRILLVR